MLLLRGLEGDEMTMLQNPFHGHLVSADFVISSDFLDGWIASDIPTVALASKGRVGFDGNVVLCSTGDCIVIVFQNVVLDLVDRRLHFRCLQELLHVCSLEVADTNTFQRTLLMIFLEHLPGGPAVP